MRENKDTNNKKKKSLTLAQKKELCEKQKDQKLSGVQLAAQYGISISTVSDILKRSEHWLSIDTTLPNANNFREKSSVYPQLEEVMSIWVDQQISRNLTINGPIIQQKAVECANLLDITNFSASAGCWAKAEILPNNNMEDSECSDNSDYEEDNIGHELQSLIDELGFVDPLAVNDYINIDNRASAEEELSLQEIVNVVKGTNEREIEEEEEQDEISTIVALNSIENVIKYIQQKDLEIGNLEMKNLIKLKKRIFFDNINEKRQSKLNEYFDFNV
ncbi:unnamed protein product [Rhizophagus irregularis]|nr:unnamed protein product [Rhizophagus irregularis]